MIEVEHDTVVIGAGVIGRAIARALAQAGRDVIVLESEAHIGQHSSSRNSEVIHAGIYYAPGATNRAWAYCARYLGDAAAGDDVAQEVFLEAWRARSRYRPTGQLGAYLAKVARNRCASHKHGQREHVREIPEVAAALPRENEEDLRAERLARVDAAVARISPKLHEAVHTAGPPAVAGMPACAK